MARKSNPEKEMAVTGAAPAKSRRPATAARPKRSTAATKKPISPVEEPETEMVLTVSAAETDASGTEPSREAIARLAYLYWLDRGGRHGSAEQDWLRAEQELRRPSEN